MVKIPIEPYLPGSAAEAHAKRIKRIVFPEPPTPLTEEERAELRIWRAKTYPKPIYLAHYNPAKRPVDLLTMIAEKRREFDAKSTDRT